MENETFSKILRDSVYSTYEENFALKNTVDGLLASNKHLGERMHEAQRELADYKYTHQNNKKWWDEDSSSAKFWVGTMVGMVISYLSYLAV